jgi:AraC family transcriptional regulator
MELNMETVTTSKVQFGPNTVLGNHVHDKPYFCAILEGSYAGKYGSKYQEGHAAETVFRPTGETHSVRFHDVETHILVIEFTPSLLQRAAEHCTGLDVSSNFRSGKLTWLAKRLWAEYRLADCCSRLAVEGLLLEMLVHVSREHAPAVKSVRVPPWLLRVREQIEETCVRGLSVGALAETADVHPVYLVTAFKRAFHSTPGEFQRRVRIRKAEALMSKRPTMPLSEVALATGFFDQSHFSRAFKHVTGFTPNKFRQDQHKSQQLPSALVLCKPPEMPRPEIQGL